MVQGKHNRPFTTLDHLLLALALLCAVVGVGTAGFVIIEHRPVIDAFYMTLITISTLGMKAESSGPISEAGKLWIVFLIVVGIATAMIALTLIVSMVVEGQVRRILGRRQVNRKIASLSNHIIVCGYGRTGGALCENLRRYGASVIALDCDAAATARAEQEGFLYVLGDATQEPVLVDAGVQRARALVTVLPSDGDNVLVTLVARDLAGELFIAASAERIESEAHLRRAGANSVICAHVIGARRLANILVRPGVVDFIDFASEGLDLEAEQVHLPAESKLAGATLRQANLPREVGILVIALRRSDGRTIFNPGPDTELQAGDLMIVTGHRGSLAQLQRRYF